LKKKLGEYYLNEYEDDYDKLLKENNWEMSYKYNPGIESISIKFF